MSNWKCLVCRKEFKNFGIKQFAVCSKTTLFGNFKVRDTNGKTNNVSRKMNIPVCSEECKQKNEEKYLVEEYKGNKIYA